MTYIYMLAGDDNERELAVAEALAFPGRRTCSAKLIESDGPIDITRTGYMACGLELIARGVSAAEAAQAVTAAGLAADRFAIDVVRIPRGFRISRHGSADLLALAIHGDPDLDNPAVRFRLFLTPEGAWFGRAIDAAEHDWERFVRKPYDFSSALPSQSARALCNLLVRDGERVIDPCCGSGSLLLHAASLGASVTGCDINKRMVGATNKNLAHYGFAGIATQADAADVAGSFDLVITNLPYGNMSAVSDDKLRSMVLNIVRLAPRGLLVAMHDLRPVIAAAGAETAQVIDLPKFSITHRIFLYVRR